MRGVRSFLVLLVLLAGLGGYAYFVESKRELGSDTKQEKVFTVEPDAIDEVSIKSESGEPTTLRKTGTDWQIVQPAAIAPDSAAVSGLTTNIAGLELQRVIDENPGDLAEFGLAKPRIEVTFKSGGQEWKLFIGSKTPTGTDLYAKSSERARVFLISSYLDSTFNKTTFDLRDKTVLKLDRDKIDTLTIATPSNALRFTKPGPEWRLAAPVDARADFTIVDGLVSRINTLQMKAIVTDKPAGLVEYGLDKPAATIQLGSGSSQASLLIGKDAGEGTVYAKDNSRPAIITVDATLLDELKKEPGEFRQKDLFDARAFNATGLVLTRKGQTLTFEKTRTKNKDGQEEEKWRQTAPAAQDVDQTKLENLLSTITQARASSFVPSTTKTGLDNPELSISVKSEPGRQEIVRFARAGADVFASRSGEPDVAKVEAATLDNIIKAADELQQKPAAKD